MTSSDHLIIATPVTHKYIADRNDALFVATARNGLMKRAVNTYYHTIIVLSIPIGKKF